MDEAIEKRKRRTECAVKLKDTSMQWDLIVAGVEGVIDFFKREGKEGTKMKGRSKIMFAKKKPEGFSNASRRKRAMPTWSPEQVG